MMRFFRELERRLAEAGLRRATADHDVVRRRARRRRGRGAADPLDRLRPGRSPRRRPALRALDAGSDTALVTDAGGTTLRRQPRPARTHPLDARDDRRRTRPTGYMTGFPSVDVKSRRRRRRHRSRGSTTAGCCTLGPQSAGADPGPACYGRGGDRPTVTDACLLLGYIDPDYFLGGEMTVSVDLAREALERDVSPTARARRPGGGRRRAPPARSSGW